VFVLSGCPHWAGSGNLYIFVLMHVEAMSENEMTRNGKRVCTHVRQTAKYEEEHR